jgi:hypothetical protein
MKPFAWIGVVAAVLATALAVPSYAQTDAGQLSGTIRDASGAFVAGAIVSARNERTDEIRRTESNAAGFFVIAPVKPST